MTQQMNITRDSSGFPSWGIGFSEPTRTAKVKLVANTEKTFTMPFDEEWYVVVFSFTGSVWVAVDETATVATTDFTYAGGQLKPAVRKVKKGAVLHFITDDTAANVNLNIYALPR